MVRVLHVRLSELLDPDAYREERWDTHTFDFDVHFYDLEDETVWGATARILTGFLAQLVAEPLAHRGLRRGDRHEQSLTHK